MLERNAEMYGPALKSARLRAGMTQEGLAQLLNREWKYISRVENGHQLPDVMTFDEWVELTQAEDFMHLYRYKNRSLQTV